MSVISDRNPAVNFDLPTSGTETSLRCVRTTQVYGLTNRRHPNKEIEAALSAAEEAGFIVKRTGHGHRWGCVRCWRCRGKDLSIWSTPRVPENIAAGIARFMKRHLHEREKRSREE
jgi:hypothetical protein